MSPSTSAHGTGATSGSQSRSLRAGMLSHQATTMPKTPATASTRRRPRQRVVEGKRLSATMEFIKERQRERTDAKLATSSTTLRQARLLHAGTQQRTALEKAGHLY